MRQEPVPGWTTSVAELGLPAGTVVRPVGSVGDRGIFLGITDEGWWLLGIDVTNGRQLFGPTRLGPEEDAKSFNCFINLPPNVLCVRQASEADAPATAWVVDTDTGRKIFDGPTDLQVAPRGNHPRVEQIGDRAIATVTDKGVYGIGPRAELTWFVPGDGYLPVQFTERNEDFRPSTLVAQGAGQFGHVVFSVVDGTIVRPSLPESSRLGSAMVFPGGFGYEYTAADRTDRVALFDDSGKELFEVAEQATLETGSTDVPMVKTDSGRRVFTLDGRQLLALPSSVLRSEVRLIGSRLFVSADPDHREWQQYDLHTGKEGATCEGEALGAYYIASDGDVAVALDTRSPAEGIDLSTCETLWRVREPESDEAKEVWKVNTTLVQRTDDKLFSLVAAH